MFILCFFCVTECPRRVAFIHAISVSVCGDDIARAVMLTIINLIGLSERRGRGLLRGGIKCGTFLPRKMLQECGIFDFNEVAVWPKV